MSTTPPADTRPAGHGGSQPWAPAFAPGGSAHGTAAHGAATTGSGGAFVPGSARAAALPPPLAPAER